MFEFNNLTSGINKTSDDFGLLVLSTSIPLFASDRVSKESVIEKDGQFTFVDGKNNKVITMTCRLISNNSSGKLSTAKDMALWLSGSGELVIRLEQDIKYEAQLLSEIPVDKTDFYQDVFTLAWDAQPISLQNFENSPLVGDPMLVSAPVPVGGFVTSIIVVGTGSETIENVGTYKISPLISIDGTADSITITNSTTSKSFTVTSITEETFVDTDNLQCFTTGPVNKLTDFSGDFFDLILGDNDIDITGTNVNATISFDFRQRYL